MGWKIEPKAAVRRESKQPVPQKEGYLYIGNLWFTRNEDGDINGLSGTLGDGSEYRLLMFVRESGEFAAWLLPVVKQGTRGPALGKEDVLFADKGTYLTAVHPKLGRMVVMKREDVDEDDKKSIAANVFVKEADTTKFALRFVRQRDEAPPSVARGKASPALSDDGEDDDFPEEEEVPAAKAPKGGKPHLPPSSEDDSDLPF